MCHGVICEGTFLQACSCILLNYANGILAAPIVPLCAIT